MKALVLLAALAAFPAHADLYRWVDPETGSVKFSSVPPPWYGDPQKQRGAPAVQVLPYRAPGGRSAKPAPEADGAAAAKRAIAALEERWAELVRFFASLPPGTDFIRGGAAIRQQLEAYQALAAELDRLDPGGAQRRRLQEAGPVDNVRKALQAAALAARPPAERPPFEPR